MEQILLHLFGDYITQSDWMAKNKTKSTWAAFVHATTYSLPFLLIGSVPAFLVIWSTHLMIDRFRLARFVAYAKNVAMTPNFPTWKECDLTGYRNADSAWLTVWLLIITDNTMHLIINYFALMHL